MQRTPDSDIQVAPARPQPWWQRLSGLSLTSQPGRPHRPRALKITFVLLLGMSALFGVMCGLMLVYSIDLPQMDDLVRYRPDTTTELYDVHGRIFGSFALERRVVEPYAEFPVDLREAIISIEDKSFESNWGVNLVRAVGAAYRDLHAKGRAQGASTLTMQLARNLFLSSEKTYGRKIQEVLLSVQIERRFTKDQIFELYANQIYLGHGTYGFEAGSEFYFSKPVHSLTLPEAALLAALPKGPEYYSPLRNPARALKRRNLVLTEMEHDHKITPAQAESARQAPLGLHIATPANSVAPYFVEEVRRQLEREYGVDAVHGGGLRVDTTLDVDLQIVANQAILDGTAAYERRHGWKGNLQNVVLAGLDAGLYQHPDWSQPVVAGSYLHAMVTSVAAGRVVVQLGTRRGLMTAPDWKWTGDLAADSFLRTGDLVYVRVVSDPAGDGPESLAHVALEQDTGVQASMMAVNNANGEIVAMVGGRDFALSQFNRATQAERQVGSSFKPYVYTTAIEGGAKPTDIIVDGPTTFSTSSGPYTPHNYEADYKGPMTLINAFAESRNIPALKLADRYGIRKVIATAQRFGITSNLPEFLPVAIGAADITLAEQVGAYSVFPNDGIRIEPHTIRRVTQSDGTPLEEKPPTVTEVISVETARTMMQLLKAVITGGTGAAASQLHHPLGGKTGTTNDYTDAWFVGFSPSITCGTWIGFDDRQSLGEKETGAKAALPMWMGFMKAAIALKPDEAFATAGAPKKELDVSMPPAATQDDSTPASGADSESASPKQAAPEAAGSSTDEPSDSPATRTPNPVTLPSKTPSDTAPEGPAATARPTPKPASNAGARPSKPASTPASSPPAAKPVLPATAPATTPKAA